MKHVSIFNINSMLNNLGHTLIVSGTWWKMKTFSTIGTPVAAISIIAMSIGLFCKCFQNKKSCSCKYTRPTTLPVNDTHSELQSILSPMPDISNQLSPQIIQEVLKASHVDFLKFKHYKQCKVQCQTSHQVTKLHYINFFLPVCLYNIPLQLTTSHIWSCQPGTQKIY